MPEFQKIEIPQGTFIGWGRKGQQVTVKVASFDPTGGKDFNGATCPQMIGTLTDDCTNYKDKGATEETLKAGEMVTVTAGVANLKRGLLAADPTPGDIVRMTFSDTYKTANGDGKVIDVEIARGSTPAIGSLAG
jgi:hypothetical protein